ncbi:Hypothetical predicted protein [Mytilus galloprovincialis]|uniref:CCHC-type domain-containing protein n=1 Tax=Mytilus galloprovincialis TaxID=29158 RepID=A0A8B6CYE9_MYTGA|nr:Hypothetical predicted protein [Mytilus galloprovincialis]
MTNAMLLTEIMSRQIKNPGNHVRFNPEDVLSLFSRQLDTADRPNPYYRNSVEEKATPDPFLRPSAAYTEDSSRSSSTAGGKNVYTSSEYFGGKKGATQWNYCNEKGHWAYQCPRQVGRFPQEKKQQ